MADIALSDLARVLASGMTNIRDDTIERVIEPGQVVTIVLSDAPFDVPSQVGDANVIGSVQHEWQHIGLAAVRWLERDA